MVEIDLSGVGYDYGIKPFFLLVGGVEFSDLFIKAGCRGMIYMFGEGGPDGPIPVQMGFLFKNEEPAKKFLDILLGWVENSDNDGDAVAIDFIENNKGGYTISIAPEVRRFEKRMIPKELRDHVTPLFMLGSHFKEIDTLGENYLKFKKNYKKNDGIAIGYYIGVPGKIEKQSEKYFVKREFNFFKQDDIPDSSMAKAYNAAVENKEFDPAKLPKPQGLTKDQIDKRRTHEMKRLLPLTLNRLENLWLADLIKELEKDYPNELVYQAICNLTVFERLKQSGELSPDFVKTGYANRIIEYLLQTFESFDAYYPPDEFFTKEKVLRQMSNDKKELVNYLNKTNGR